VVTCIAGKRRSRLDIGNSRLSIRVCGAVEGLWKTTATTPSAGMIRIR